MTIRVTIKNEEATGGRSLRVLICERPRKGSDTENFGGEIPPQQTREFYVHAAQHLVVEERV